MVRLVSSVRFRQGAPLTSSKYGLLAALMLQMAGGPKYPLVTVIGPLPPTAGLDNALRDGGLERVGSATQEVDFHPELCEDRRGHGVRANVVHRWPGGAWRARRTSGEAVQRGRSRLTSGTPRLTGALPCSRRPPRAHQTSCRSSGTTSATAPWTCSEGQSRRRPCAG